MMQKNSLLKAGSLLFMGLLLGRLLGLVREIAMAYSYGVSPAADIIIALVTLPDIVINIFVGNAAAAVFVPMIQNQSSTKKLKFFVRLSLVFFAVFSTIALVMFYRIDLLGRAILPSQNNSDVFLQQLRWTLLAIPFLALNSISRLFLQSENNFFLIGMENVIFNVFIISAIFVTKGGQSLYYITGAIILGSILRWLVQVAKVFKLYGTESQSESSELPIRVKDFYLFSQALSASLIVQLVPILGRSLSSYFEGDGGLAIFNYVYKFSEFAVVLSISIGSTVLFPKLSNLFTTDLKVFNSFVKNTQKKLILVFLPLSFLIPTLLILSIPYVSHFSFLQKFNIELFFTYLALCLAFLFVRALNEFYIIVFNAKRDVTTPVKTTFIAALIGLISIYFLTQTYGILGAFIGINMFYTTNLGFNYLFLFRFSRGSAQNSTPA